MQLLVFDWNGTLYNARAGVLTKGLSPLFPGVPEVLQQLSAQGFLLGIATGEARPLLMQQLQHYKIDHYFSAISTASETFAKPHPQMLIEVIDQVGGSAEQTLMIGDTSSDMQLAANAGVKALAVTYGMHPKQVLAQYHPLGYLSDIQELPEWLFHCSVCPG